MADESLLTLLDDVRGKTLRVLEDVASDEARWAPKGLHNTILWHAGHSYVVVESLSMRPVGGSPQLPDGWFAMFSWESRPAEVPADRWPPLAEVVGQLEAQKARLHGLYAGLTDAQLAGPSREGPDRTVRGWIVHGLQDEACHCGEILLMKKLFRSGNR